MALQLNLEEPRGKRSHTTKKIMLDDSVIMWCAYSQPVLAKQWCVVEIIMTKKFICFQDQNSGPQHFLKYNVHTI